MKKGRRLLFRILSDRGRATAGILMNGKQRFHRMIKATAPQCGQWLRKRCDFREQRSMEKAQKEIKDRSDNPDFTIFLLLKFH